MLLNQRNFIKSFQEFYEKFMGLKHLGFAGNVYYDHKYLRALRIDENIKDVI